MECMEARALKSSFSSELAMKSNNPQTASLSFDDFWCVTNGLTPSDDFSVDEFFDLPNDDNFDGASFFEEEEEEEEKDSSFSLSSQNVDDSNSNSTTTTTNNFSPDDLAIPDDDVQELELWSHLMDDSIPEPNLACPNPVLDTQKAKTGFNFVSRTEPVYGKPVHARVPFIPSAVPVKPRSKRSRSAGNRSWGLVLSPKTESPSSSATSSPVSILFYPTMARDLCLGVNFPFGKPSMKKAKKKPEENGASAIQRRCSHCQVTKTPQWRAGPNGPKTLCNACGVRFKSGRLFPEYRPACSPTFSSEVHSNSHRKVLEMRKKKESYESVSGPTSMVLAT